MIRGGSTGARRICGLVVVVMSAVAAACGSSSHPHGSSSTSSQRASGACAWATKADATSMNLAYPDTATTYWAINYRLAPGEYLELHGRFPDARYISFITYGVGGGVNTVLTDRDIAADGGSTNPYRDGGAPGGAYTVQLRGDERRGTNVVRAAPVGSPSPATTTTTIANATGSPAPLGHGGPTIDGTVGGTVIYRVYLSSAPNDRTGGGGLPEVVDVQAGDLRTTVATCAHPAPNPAALAIVDANGPATDSPAPAQPIFIRPQRNATNLYPDPDNIYLATILHYTPGRLVVVRGKAPTFPDTSAGVHVTGREQVRYWSLCTDEYRKPYPVSSCVADHDVVLDALGRYTIVVSTRAERPANATAANGITWLDWGSTAVDNLLLMRHLLARASDPWSAARLRPGALASSRMGAYTPRGVYCQVAAFAAGGVSGCPGS